MAKNEIRINDIGTKFLITIKDNESVVDISGTGSDEILIFSVLTFCSPGDEVIHARHGFEMYPIIAKTVIIVFVSDILKRQFII